MITAIIRWSLAHRLMVLVFSLALALGGLVASRSITVDAIPDLSDVQVIVRTEWAGQAPEVIENQVTFPVATAMLSVPGSESVRAVSMFNDSFVYIIFADGTDPYWARTRVLEQLATISGSLPEGVSPQLGPDASGVGWVYQYALTTGPYSPDHPEGWWYDAGEDRWYGSRAEVPHERANAVALRRIAQRGEVRWLDPVTGLTWTDPDLAPASRQGQLKELHTQQQLTVDPITGNPLHEPDVDLAELRSLQDWFLRFELSALEGVSEVASVGGFEKQYQLSIDPNVLLAYDLSMEDIARAVAASNQDVGGGSVERGGFALLLRGRGYLGDLPEGAEQEARATGPLALSRARSQQVLNDLAQIPLRSDANGVPLLLSQIARIEEVPERRSGIADLDGIGESVGGIVVMRYGENARQVIQRVQDRMDELRSSLPPGVDVVTTYDRSDLIDRAVATLQKTLGEEILVVSLVVLLFLLHARSALVAVVVLPVAVLASILTMHLLGVSANIMSLGGIAIAIGVMVDSSIIMVEAGHRALEEERQLIRDGATPRARHAILSQAACSVGPSLFSSLLIITLAFLPIFVLGGESGRLFGPLAVTKTVAMAFAALLSVTLIPALVTLLVTQRVLPSQWSLRRSFIFSALIMIIPALLIGLWPLQEFVAYRWWMVGGWLLATGIILIPQGLLDEDRHPLTRLLRWMYRPLFAVGMAWPRTSLVVAAAVVVVTFAGPFQKLGQEFMPPLEEGDFLYMPNTDRLPGTGQAGAMLQMTDAIFASFPEVKTVQGKIGRADTATDPAPLTMIETTIQLERDRSKWRHVPEERFFGLWTSTRPITVEELTDGYLLPGGERVPGINDALAIPGLYGSLTRGAMPIRTRLDMLRTGFRTPVGIKLMGDDLQELNVLADEVRALLQADAALAQRTRDISTEAINGGRYVDIRPDRSALARYGLSMQQVQGALAMALGGRRVTMTVEGRSRYGVSLRFPRELRDSVARLGDVLLPTSQGAHIPLAQVAEIAERNGPPMIRSENARLSAWLFITPEPGDVVGYVEQAKAVLDAGLTLPSGYSLVWAGTYEQVQESNARLAVAVPLVLMLIVFILLIHLRSLLKTLLIFGALSFSVVGAIWLVFFLGYDLSLAVWVGVIALLGLDAETSLVMLHYQDEALERAQKSGRLTDEAGLRQAVFQGAVPRIRPKVMTVLTTIVGLMPLMYASGVGADTMQRLAAPMIGGLVSSTLMELVLLPAAYFLIQRRHLRANKGIGSDQPKLS